MASLEQFHARECRKRRLAIVVSGERQLDRTDTFVPLREAVDRLGRLRFPDSWTDDEQLLYCPPELPIPVPAYGGGMAGSLFNAPSAIDQPVRWYKQPSDEVFSYVDRLLQAVIPDLAPKPRPVFGMLGATWPPQVPSYTMRQWRAAMDLNEQHKAIVQAEWIRLSEVQTEFKQLCVSNKLRTVLRGFEGGDFSEPLGWWAWNGETIWQRFVSQRMSPTDPFGNSAFAEATHWIFVSNDDLKRLEGVAARPSDVFDVRSYLSPTLRCALDVTRALCISKDNMPKLEVVEAEIPKHWHEPSPLSATMTRNIARIVRDEDSRLGRASRHDKVRRTRKPEPA